MGEERFRPRWCGSLYNFRNEPHVPVQGGRVPKVPKELAELAYEEYVAQGHGGQSFDRLHERGGFGVLEMALLLADALERERHKNARRSL